LATKYLLDTHTLLWWFYEPERLSPQVHGAIADAASLVYCSAVSAMEISTKYRIGKLEMAKSLATEFVDEIRVEGFAELSLTAAHAQQGGNLLIPHQDPFDRMLIAQAQIEQMTLVSNEKIFDQFGVIRLW
jgi:PIN domain nuclease of toxin-antitoxin system